MEPKQKLAEALEKYKRDANEFITVKHGDLNQLD